MPAGSPALLEAILACGWPDEPAFLGCGGRLTQRPEAYTCFSTKLCKVLQLHWENFPLFIDSMRLLPFIALAFGLLAIICEFAASCCSGPTPTSSQIVASVPHCVTLLGDCLHARTRIGHIMARPPIVPNPIPHRPSLSRWQTMVVSKAISRLLLTERDRGIS